MFGVNIWYVLIIIALGYILYRRECRNIILEHEINDFKCKKKDKIPEDDEEIAPDNTPKKSRELYSKMNDIVQKNLGISLREMVLGKN